MLEGIISLQLTGHSVWLGSVEVVQTSLYEVQLPTGMDVSQATMQNYTQRAP